MYILLLCLLQSLSVTKKVLLIEALPNSLKLECYKNKFLKQFIFVKHMDCRGAWARTKDNNIRYLVLLKRTYSRIGTTWLNTYVDAS